MTRYGVCCDALNPGANPDFVAVDPFRLVRVQARRDPGGTGVDPTLRSYVADLQAHAIQIVLVLDKDAFTDPNHRPQRMADIIDYLNVLHPAYVVVGNEMDGEESEEGASWIMSHADWAALWVDARTAAADFPEVRLVAGGLISGDPQWATDAVAALPADCLPPEWWDLHLYVKGASRVREVLDRYAEHQARHGETWGWCSFEWNCVPGRKRSYLAMMRAFREYKVDAATYFGWDDNMSPGRELGLVNYPDIDEEVRAAVRELV
jgi:hypothetical protein